MRTLQEMHHCLVYSLGGREDASFEDELADRTLCEVCHPSAFCRARISESHPFWLQAARRRPALRG